MPQLIKKIADMMLNSPFEVAAIEMSPQFHLKFVHELLHDHEGNKDIALGMNGLSFMSLPILFVHGSDDYFRLASKARISLSSGSGDGTQSEITFHLPPSLTAMRVVELAL